jgi:hypothetical protein
MEPKKQIEYVLKQPKKEGIPKRVKKVVKKFGYSDLSIIEDGYYSNEILNEIIEKNKLRWFYDMYIGNTLTKKEGLIQFNSETIYLFYKRREDESSYKFYFALYPDSKDSLTFYLNTIKKYKLI